MKKAIIFALLLVMTLTSCDYTIPENFEETSTAPQKQVGFNVPHEIEYSFDRTVSYNTNISWLQDSSEGIMFINSDGILCEYIPSSNISSTVCKDPVCEHQINSECIYGNLAINTLVPIYHNNTLFYTMQELEPGSDFKWCIFSSEINSLESKRIYKNDGNTIGYLIPHGDHIYFNQLDGDNLAPLYRISKDGSNIIKTDGEYFISNYIVLGDTVVFNNALDGKVYSCDLDLKNITELFNPKTQIAMMTDGVNIYYQLLNKIMMYDMASDTLSEVITVDDSRNIYGKYITENELYYTLINKNINFNQSYESRLEGMKEDQVLYKYDLNSGETTEYKLPESMLCSHEFIINNGAYYSRLVVPNEKGFCTFDNYCVYLFEGEKQTDDYYIIG